MSPLTGIVCSLQRKGRPWEQGPVPRQTGALGEGKSQMENSGRSLPKRAIALNINT